MAFDIGALVRARGREWVVLPESKPELLVLRPLGGSDEEVTGIYIGKGSNNEAFEAVTSAEFPLPDPAQELGNYLSCGLLRDAVRLGIRSAAGPFRSLGSIGVEPRPYQLVPLLMALKLEPIRMLIADEQGIGKTIEALLIARELLDRAEIKRMVVMCPPHLAEQWQRAMRDQFHLDSTLILSSTAARLERDLSTGESLFEHYPITVVSTDYVKQERRRNEFLRACPELVIVDEAHNCAETGSSRSSAQQRHALLKELSKNPKRHLLLVTAAPHSGSPQAFRSLLGLLDENLLQLSEDLSGEQNRKHREQLARHLVQRRRGDITAYLQAETPFPKRETKESHYALDNKYRAFLQDVVDYCRESVFDKEVDHRRQRIRWWSALALLRSISSSPAAAVSTLRKRANNAEAETLEDVEVEGRRAILDLDDENQEAIDVSPGSQEDDADSNHRRRLLGFAKDAEALQGKADNKLAHLEKCLRELSAEGYSPVVFCRFIPTVGYVVEHLRKKLKGVEVIGVDGTLPPEEREARIREVAAHPKRVLICTDCLSEGINLQEHFDAVVHYDLAWNPTRHEQREGRVDRFGQQKETVRALTIYGNNNPVDGIVLTVLLRKQQTIQKQLGVAVPIPEDKQVVERAIMEGLLLRKTRIDDQFTFDFLLEPTFQEADKAWDAAIDREKKSRAIFAQHQLQKATHDELSEELKEIYRALGNDHDVERFVRNSLQSLRATIKEGPPLTLNVKECSAALKDAIGVEDNLQAVFRGRVFPGAVSLTRTTPFVAGLSRFVLEGALDPRLEGPAKRCGVIRSQEVSIRHTLILLRMRFHIITKEKVLLVEDQTLTAFQGAPSQAQWLSTQEAEALLQKLPSSNIDPAQARQTIERTLQDFPALSPHISMLANKRKEELLASHRRVRRISEEGLRGLKVEVLEPVDILGVFVYLPEPRKAGVA